MKFFDTHCHLFFEDFQHDLDEVVSKAREAGVAYIMAPSTQRENFDEVISLVEKYDHIYGAIGIHPYDAHLVSDADFAEIERLMSHPKIKAIGETGLDFHREGSEVEVQIRSFEWHIELSRRVNKPIIVHCRAAKDEIFKLLEKHKPHAVIHCFSEDLEYAKKILDLGMYISFTGILTYERSKKLQAVAKEIDLSRILIETDAPYLRPGRERTDIRCEPKDCVEVARTLAALKGISLEEMADVTTQNAKDFFGLN